MTGRAIDAEEALRLHLVSAVVPPGQLLEIAAAYAANVARAPRENLVRTKAKAIRRAAVAGPTLDL
jgi:enoyl-CoA hydratase